MKFFTSKKNQKSKSELTFFHCWLEHDITNIFDVEEVLGFEMANNLHDVLFFDPDEEHPVFHDIIGNTETLEILDCNASRLSLGSFFIFAGVFCFGLYFEVNLIFLRIKFG